MMPRRNRNTHATTLDADALADQATQVASGLNGCNGSRSRPRSHLAIRIDPLPPWSDPDDRYYWCPACGYLTGAGRRIAAIPHEIPGPDRRITYRDLNLPEPVPHIPGCPCARCLTAPFTTRRRTRHARK
jgi:hypothetical protein